MNPEAQQRVMEFASEVIARESSKVVESIQPGNGVELLGNMISADFSSSQQTFRKKDLRHAAKIMVSDRVEVLPFVVAASQTLSIGSLKGWIIPTMGGRPVFGNTSASLPRRSGGAGVYLQCEYDVEVVSLSANFGTLKKASVVQLDLKQKFPNLPAQLKVKVDKNSGNTIEILPEKVKATSLLFLGLYTRDGTVFQKVSASGSTPINSVEDPMDGGRGPHYLVPPSHFPFTVEYEFVEPPSPP